MHDVYTVKLQGMGTFWLSNPPPLLIEMTSYMRGKKKRGLFVRQLLKNNTTLKTSRFE